MEEMKRPFLEPDLNIQHFYEEMKDKIFEYLAIPEKYLKRMAEENKMTATAFRMQKYDKYVRGKF